MDTKTSCPYTLVGKKVNRWVKTAIGVLWSLSFLRIRIPIKEGIALTDLEELFVEVLHLFLRLLPLIVLTGITLSFPLALEKSWSIAKTTMQSSFLWRVVGIAGLLGIAYFLYCAKIRAPISYGGMEFWVGGVTCWLGLAEKNKDDLVATLALIGGIGVLIRGWENVSKGFKPLLREFRKIRGIPVQKPNGKKKPITWPIPNLMPLIREMIPSPPWRHRGTPSAGRSSSWAELSQAELDLMNAALADWYSSTGEERGGSEARTGSPNNEQHLENLRRNAQPMHRKYEPLIGLPVNNSASDFAGTSNDILGVVDTFLQMVNTATDQPSYDLVIAALLQAYPKLAMNIPRIYDPTFIKALQRKRSQGTL